MNVQRGRMVSGGRIQVPADIRREMGLKDGDTVTMEVVDGKLQVRPYRAVIADIQVQMRKYVQPGISIVDEFTAERRAEAERE